MEQLLPPPPCGKTLPPVPLALWGQRGAWPTGSWPLGENSMLTERWFRPFGHLPWAGIGSGNGEAALGKHPFPRSSSWWGPSPA